MFTGLIEEIGIIRSTIKSNGGLKIKVKANKVMTDIKIDDSIAINGCCQTVIKHDRNSFEVIAIEETLRKTNLGELKSDSKVNLERAIQSGNRLGGHIVQGHIDCVGEIIAIKSEGSSKLYSLRFPEEYKKYVINVGSICINGISLTVANLESNSLSVAIIPHTLETTTISNLKVGSKVNLEFDMIGKYIFNMVSPYINKLENKSSVFDQFKK